MNFINFAFRSSTQAIEIFSDNLTWDLHNFATFVGLEYHAEKRVFEIEWSAKQMEDPWGCPNNRFGGCHLRFQGVRSIRVTQNPVSMLSADSFCLHGVSKVDPLANEHRFKAEWREGEPFNLLFEFTSGWEIEVDAASAELIPAS